MAHDAHQISISPEELFQTAEAVARSGRRQVVQIHGQTLAIVPRASAKHPSHRQPRRTNGFLAAYGSVSALPKPLTDSEITELAAEEAADEAASAGLHFHADA